MPQGPRNQPETKHKILSNKSIQEGIGKTEEYPAKYPQEQDRQKVENPSEEAKSPIKFNSSDYYAYYIELGKVHKAPDKRKIKKNIEKPQIHIQINEEQIRQEQIRQEKIQKPFDNFINVLHSIEDSSEFKAKAQPLADELNKIKNNFFYVNMNANAVTSMLATTIYNYRPQFRSQTWQKVADLAIQFLNAIKSVLNELPKVNLERTRLFSEQKNELNKMVDDVIKKLEDDVQEASAPQLK